MVMNDRLMQERSRDEFIHQVDGLGGASILESAAPGDRDVIQVLREAQSAPREGKAERLLLADRLVAKLSVTLTISRRSQFAPNWRASV